MLTLDIPGFGSLHLKHLVSDYSGTLSVDGKLRPHAAEKLDDISSSLQIHILTADTFGKVRQEMKSLNCDIHVLTGKDHDLQKELYIKKLGAESVIAFGNGLNDRKMLRLSRIGIAVCMNEGCAKEAFEAADIFVMSAEDALDLLLNPKRLIATLRF